MCKCVCIAAGLGGALVPLASVEWVPFMPSDNNQMHAQLSREDCGLWVSSLQQQARTLLSHFRMWGTSITPNNAQSLYLTQNAKVKTEQKGFFLFQGMSHILRVSPTPLNLPHQARCFPRHHDTGLCPTDDLRLSSPSHSPSLGSIVIIRHIGRKVGKISSHRTKNNGSGKSLRVHLRKWAMCVDLSTSLPSGEDH